ncbi:curli production assembly/transport component CsgF [Fodinibius sediminis]|uniref:Curli production assembly/transport component CsgF n=1 Tax=Fodinibius sediminis TaxID=1214077 RepID=A0A521CI85_9BACT|nr:curli production assembly/transport component CsgF [Fodinibius sediminis]SMO58451.1 curli production assembly/transport component CsgF [Fodinibius sediminis]
MDQKKLLFPFVLSVCVVLGLSNSAEAQDFVYQPKNPAFGGSYANYSWLLNSANQQNKFQGGRSGFNRDPLANFEQSLQRQVLSQLTRQIIGDRFGEDNVNLNEQNSYEFGEFNIKVNPGPDGVSIDIQNILSGESTSITIPTGFSGND